MSVNKKTNKPFPLTVTSGVDVGAVTQNTWYTALSVKNAVVSYFLLKVTVADETLEARVTIDGVLIGCGAGVAVAVAGNHSTGITTLRYVSGGWYLTLDAASLGMIGVTTLPHWCRGRSILIEVRKTTAGGASHILCEYQYQQG